jgi:SPX domain protein involved in polyphosphate accumulation
MKREKIFKHESKITEEDYEIFYKELKKEIKKINDFSIEKEEEFMEKHELLQLKKFTVKK